MRPEQILPGELRTRSKGAPIVSAEDGYNPDTPRRPLRWWREKRALTREHLTTQLADVTTETIRLIEIGKPKSTKASAKKRISDVLKVAPDKVIFPGEDENTWST